MSDTKDFFTRKPGESNTSRYIQMNVKNSKFSSNKSQTKQQSSSLDTLDKQLESQLKNTQNQVVEFTKENINKLKLSLLSMFEDPLIKFYKLYSKITELIFLGRKIVTIITGLQQIIPFIQSLPENLQKLSKEIGQDIYNTLLTPKLIPELEKMLNSGIANAITKAFGELLNIDLAALLCSNPVSVIKMQLEKALGVLKTELDNLLTKIVSLGLESIERDINYLQSIIQNLPDIAKNVLGIIIDVLNKILKLKELKESIEKFFKLIDEIQKLIKELSENKISIKDLNLCAMLTNNYKVYQLGEIIKKVDIKEAKPTNNKSRYGFINVKETKSGHAMIMDDTPGNRRLVFQHTTGTYTSMLDNGDYNEKVVNNKYMIVEKDLLSNILGNSVNVVQGDTKYELRGNVYEVVDKEKNVLIKSNKNEKIQGDSALQISGHSSEYIIGNRNEKIENDKFSNVGNNEVKTITNNKTTTVGNSTSIANGNKLNITNGNEINIENGLNPTLLDLSGNINLKNYLGNINISNYLGNIDIKNGQSINIKTGNSVDAQAGVSITIKAGGIIEISALGPVNIKSSSVVSIKGGIVKLN